MFMVVTQQGAVHLGNDYLDNLHATKNWPQRTVKILFDVTRKLVKEQKEIQGISMIIWQENSWKSTTLLTDQAVQLPIQYCAWEESVKNPVKAWKEVCEFIPMSRIGSNRRGADGVRVEKCSRIHYFSDSRRDPEH